MSESNLHTCEKAAAGWARQGLCAECQRQRESNARLSAMFKDRVRLPITAIACPPPCDHDFSRPMQELEPNSGMWSKVCAKCGVSALDVSLMELP